jgi:hypothetical protein
VGGTVGVGDVAGMVGGVVTLTGVERVGAGVAILLGAVAMGAPAGIVAAGGLSPAGAISGPGVPGMVPCT